MSKGRKTVPVDFLITEANRLMALPDNEHVTPEFRKGVSALLEKMLHATDRYAGFEWTEWANGGHAAWIADGKPLEPCGVPDKYMGDKTRKTYFGAAPTVETAEDAARHYPGRPAFLRSA